MNKRFLNKITLSDCFDYLEKIEDASVDLAVIDPPYNLNMGDWDEFKSDKLFFEFTYKWIDKLIPKMKSNSSLYVFNTPRNSAYILAYLESKNLIFQNWITWDKRDGLSYSKSKYTNAQETILFFTFSKKHVFNYNDIRHPYQSTSRMKHAESKGILKNGKRWYPNPNGKLCSEVWHITSERHKRKVHGKVQKLDHSTPKPLEMIKRIILASSNKNDTVLDCFVGSGTTALACILCNRNYLCCDSSAEYVKLAKKRINGAN